METPRRGSYAEYALMMDQAREAKARRDEAQARSEQFIATCRMQGSERVGAAVEIDESLAQEGQYDYEQLRKDLFLVLNSTAFKEVFGEYDDPIESFKTVARFVNKQLGLPDH